jgi:hypothetical protein
MRLINTIFIHLKRKVHNLCLIYLLLTNSYACDALTKIIPQYTRMCFFYFYFFNIFHTFSTSFFYICLSWNKGKHIRVYCGIIFVKASHAYEFVSNRYIRHKLCTFFFKCIKIVCFPLFQLREM